MNRWVFQVDGQWLTLPEICQRTGITRPALRARLRECRDLLDRFDPELLAHPNRQVYRVAREHYRAGSIVWTTEELATVFRMTPDSLRHLIHQSYVKLRSRHPQNREWVES